MFQNNFGAKFKLFLTFSPVIDKTIEKILKRNFPSEKPPMSVVMIRVAPQDVDVNLEPNKQTVILRCAKDIEVSVDNVVSEHFGKGRADAVAEAAEAPALSSAATRSPAAAAAADSTENTTISTFNFAIDET